MWWVFPKCSQVWFSFTPHGYRTSLQGQHWVLADWNWSMHDNWPGFTSARFNCKICCSSLSPAHKFSISLVKIQAYRLINHVCSSGSSCSSYVNAMVREGFPSVPYSGRHLNDDKCTTRSGNIELAGHLSGNVWIWKITFCKWTQIKMYILPFSCNASVSV